MWKSLSNFLLQKRQKLVEGQRLRLQSLSGHPIALLTNSHAHIHAHSHTCTHTHKHTNWVDHSKGIRLENVCRVRILTIDSSNWNLQVYSTFSGLHTPAHTTHITLRTSHTLQTSHTSHTTHQWWRKHARVCIGTSGNYEELKPATHYTHTTLNTPHTQDTPLHNIHHIQHTPHSTHTITQLTHTIT